MSTETGTGPVVYRERRIALQAGVVVVFLMAMGAAIYWLTSGDVEKRLGRTRMLEELRKEQAPPADDPPAAYDVTPLVDRDYFERLRVDLARARQTIEVMMFEIKLGKQSDNPANRLVDELVASAGRGVTVRVRLEQSNLDKALTRTNRKTEEYLKTRGVACDFDLADVETHAKAVLIDGRILYVGNHNWSESALAENKEVSLRVESPRPLTAMRRYFDRFDRAMEKARLGAWRWLRPTEAWAAEARDVVFLTNEEYLPVLRESIREAVRTIYIEMYLIRPGSSEGHPVNVIVSELAAARKRGVHVSVLMDRHFEQDYQKAAERLRAADVQDVRVDEGDVTNHTKLVLIDDEILIVGSQNWTLSALAASNESAVYVRSAGVAVELKQKLRRLSRPEAAP